MPTDSWGAEYRYDSYTWPEIRDVANREPQPVILLPVGSVEDHGYHAPIDLDNFLVWNVCEGAAKRIPEEVLLLPPVSYGFEDHHMDFPGTISVKPKHLEDFVVDITTSVASHGFRKILIADGHGSNMPILELSARRTILESDALCAVFPWWNLVRDIGDEVRESEKPGGTSHAAELETSVYLHLDPERIQMDKAVDEMGNRSPWWYADLLGGSGPVLMMNWWSRFSKSGVSGQATLATAEKGKRFYEHAVETLIRLIRDFREFPIAPREDMH
jgi:creatinine amidohydrolase